MTPIEPPPERSCGIVHIHSVVGVVVIVVIVVVVVVVDAVVVVVDPVVVVVVRGSVGA